eukprot:s4017_g1.t1
MSKGAASVETGEDESKIHRRITWLNANVFPDRQISEEALAAVQSLPVARGLELLKDLEEKAAKITNPSGYLKTAVQREGAGVMVAPAQAGDDDDKIERLGLFAVLQSPPPSEGEPATDVKLEGSGDETLDGVLDIIGLPSEASALTPPDHPPPTAKTANPPSSIPPPPQEPPPTREELAERALQAAREGPPEEPNVSPEQAASGGTEEEVEEVEVEVEEQDLEEEQQALDEPHEAVPDSVHSPRTRRPKRPLSAPPAPLRLLTRRQREDQELQENIERARRLVPRTRLTSVPTGEEIDPEDPYSLPDSHWQNPDLARRSIVVTDNLQSQDIHNVTTGNPSTESEGEESPTVSRHRQWVAAGHRLLEQARQAPIEAEFTQRPKTPPTPPPPKRQRVKITLSQVDRSAPKAPQSPRTPKSTTPVVTESPVASSVLSTASFRSLRANTPPWDIQDPPVEVAADRATGAAAARSRSPRAHWDYPEYEPAANRLFVLQSHSGHRPDLSNKRILKKPLDKQKLRPRRDQVPVRDLHPAGKEDKYLVWTRDVIRWLLDEGISGILRSRVAQPLRRDQYSDEWGDRRR